MLSLTQMYASAVGTTVLQLKEIPTRPAEYEGGIAIFGPVKGLDEAKIRAALEQFGTITSCKLGVFPPAVVKFTTHASALAAKRAVSQLISICSAIDTQ